MKIDYLIHAYKKGTEPFRSLSALGDVEALDIMRDLYIKGSVFWERFEDPARYLQLRKQVEEWLRSAFLAKGGKPQAPYPIYMMLGRSKWVQTMLDAMDCLAIHGEQIFPVTLLITSKRRSGTTHRFCPTGSVIKQAI